MASALKGPGHKAEIEIARAEAPELRKVTWYKDPGLRKLYVRLMLAIMLLCLESLMVKRPTVW